MKKHLNTFNALLSEQYGAPRINPKKELAQYIAILAGCLTLGSAITWLRVSMSGHSIPPIFGFVVVAAILIFLALAVFFACTTPVLIPVNRALTPNEITVVSEFLWNEAGLAVLNRQPNPLRVFSIVEAFEAHRLERIKTERSYERDRYEAAAYDFKGSEPAR